MEKLVVWTIGTQFYALPFALVERVVHAVEVTPLPDAPEIITGIINVQGTIVPVMNVRARLRQPLRPVRLSDQIVLARTSRRRVAFFVDEVTGLRDCSEHALVDADAIIPGMVHVAGIVKFSDGMILIHDLDSFLSIDEEQLLGEALSHEQ